MIIHNVQQGSDTWKSLRCGRITASCFDKVLAKGEGKTRNSYMMQIIAERLTGVTQDNFCNDAMNRGSELEHLACLSYELHSCNLVRHVGFVEKDEYVGVSPDGLIGDNGGLECKCPNSSTHIEYLLRGKLPSKYVAQVQGNLWVCEREWWDFVSYDNRVEKRPYCCYRVNRDEKYIKNLDIEIKRFIVEMNNRIDDIMAGEK